VNDVWRRALRNGLIATILAGLVGFTVDAALSNRGPNPEATPTESGPPPRPACTAVWEVVPSVQPDPAGNQLLGVAALSRSLAWAVGAKGPPDAPTSTLIERWNGDRWGPVASPNGGQVTNLLRAVDARTPADAWAVGESSSGGKPQPLVVHWDGVAWTLSAVPFLTSGGALFGVVAIGPDDVWAVGSSGDPTAGLEHALALHWDGLSWTTATLHVGGGRSLLADVSAVSSSDVWAVGYHHNGPLIVRFDGRKWTTSPIQVPGKLDAVDAIGPDEVWAGESALLRWDGAEWSVGGTVRTGGTVTSIAGTDPAGLWAVGVRSVGGTTRSLVQRFDGTRWALARGPGVQGPDVLTDGSAAPDGSLWAVGYHDVPQGRFALVARARLTCG